MCVLVVHDHLLIQWFILLFRYYYNRVTEKSQWIKPEGWEKAESVIFPVIDRFQQNREESGFGDNIQVMILIEKGSSISS